MSGASGRPDGAPDGGVRRKGPWSAREVEAFLARTRVPIRLACHGASGHPIIASLWFAPIEGRLWCATKGDARVARRIARDPRCAFEVAGDRAPYCGVRGQGDASLHPERGREVLEALIDRYLGDRESRFARWLLEGAERETAIAIAPRSLVSWDFRKRMAGATPRT